MNKIVAQDKDFCDEYYVVMGILVKYTYGINKHDKEIVMRKRAS